MGSFRQKVLFLMMCTVFISGVLSFAFSEEQVLKTQFINISPGEDFSESEVKGTKAFNEALKTRLVQSPYFQIETAEGDRVIHGNLTRFEGIFLVQVSLTDFESDEIIAAAAAEFLSFSQYAFAVDLIVAQLEGREVADLYTGRAVGTPLGFNPPDITVVKGDDSVYQMEEMLLESLDRANTLYEFGDYPAAEEVFSSFIDRYDSRLSEEYHALFLPIRDYALERWELTRSLSLFKQAGEKAKTEEFEDALQLYIQARNFMKELPEESRTETLKTLLTLAEEATEKLKPICKTLLMAREGEFVFRINFFAFNDDQAGLEKAFLSFYDYASASRFTSLVQNNYNKKREFFSRSFKMDKVPMFSVYVEGGTFAMGSEDYNNDEKPVHTVTLSSFYIEPFEVTFSQYADYCVEMKKKIPMPEHQGIGIEPITGVSWYDAVEFCNWLSEKEGLTPCYEIRKDIQDPGNHNASDKFKWSVNWDREANGYRLPTEAEWEYAARGGNSSEGYLYSGSNFLDEAGWYMNTSRERIQPVGRKKPNELLIYDMSGNVYELCWDWHGRDVYKVDNVTDPVGADGGTQRMVRGGSWHDPAEYCRSTYRNWTNAVHTSDKLGFRMARNAEK